MNDFIRILQYVKKYSGQAVLNIFFNILSALFSLVSIIMIIPFLELIFDLKQPSPNTPDLSFSVTSIVDFFYYHMGKVIETEGRVSTLMYLCLAVVIVFFLKNLFRYLAQFYMAPVRNGVVRDIRFSLYNKILELPLSYFSSRRKGDLISRMNADTKEIEHSIMSTLEVLFKEPLTILIYLAALVYMSPVLTGFVLVMLLITGLLIGRIGRSLKKQSKKGQQSVGMITSMLEETLSGMRIIKAFNAENAMNAKFREENNRYLNLMNNIIRRRDLSSPLSEFFAIAILSGVLFFGGKLVLDPNYPLNAQTFIGFMVIFSQLIPPAKGFATAFYNIQKGLAASERINEVLDAENKITEKKNPLAFKLFQDKISFRNLSFAYYNYDDKKVLDNIDIDIKKGKMIALVGQSGAGKTTMVDLLPRFYDPVEGKILLDDTDIRDMRLHDLRSQMGIVTQESILFHDTVFNNIAIGKPSASFQEVKEAAMIANAHDFIETLNEGYDTIIGDRGDQLSGGERQRLTIARAILKNPPILILDEATSSLDSESERLVQDALIKLMKNRTSIVIAHRLSTIQYADEILVMQDGRIIERGNHISLTSKDSTYKKLVDLQAF